MKSRTKTVRALVTTVILCQAVVAGLFWVVNGCSGAAASEPASWWNSDWHYRTTVSRTTPWRDDTPRPVELAIDFPLLIQQGNVAGQFDPESVRVVERAQDGTLREVPVACRSEFDARKGHQQSYLSWMARPSVGQQGTYDIYFGTRDQQLPPATYGTDQLPPENLLTNGGFEEDTGKSPAAWTLAPRELVSLNRFAHTTGTRSLAVVVDQQTPAAAGREVTIAQQVDVRQFAGQEVVFQCDLLAERAAYGAPVSIELEQYRADGSRILEYAVEPRWLTIELAQGQLVQFSERGRFSPEAASCHVKVRMQCSVRDADTRAMVTGPDSYFTIWLDRLVLRPGERWAWPAETSAGFVAGELPAAPLNRGFQFTGQRRLAFNGASEGTLTAGRYNPDVRSVHWGLQTGTLEFWCRPEWAGEDRSERIFFDSVAYGHRLQSRMRRLFVDGKEHIEFSIADSGGALHTVRGPAQLQTGQGHHVAATWSHPEAQLQLFVDGRRIANTGPHDRPWPSSLVPVDKDVSGGIGIAETDRRSMPMQAFIGGDKECQADRAAESVLDEFRISDIVRYHDSFAPSRQEFSIDPHTRVLFHLENERDGIHDADDQYVRGHLACELPRHQETVRLEILQGDVVTSSEVLVQAHATDELFDKNRVENRLPVTRPTGPLPDPRFVEYRPQQYQQVVATGDESFLLEVGGQYPPIMRSVTFEPGPGALEKSTLVPRWRANDSVVPLSVASLAATLAPDVKDDNEKALAVMRYALATSNYYDAHFCETLPTRHRSRVSYSLLKAVNIYAFDQCGPLNYTLRKMFLSAGISSNDASGTHHQFQQAFYHGSWRLFDLSPRKYWLDRDNFTVASRRTFEDDLYLKLRQGDGVTSGIRGRVSKARFGSAERPHLMDFTLNSGERASVCWHNEGRWFEVTEQRQAIPLAKVPPYFGNGAVVYTPTVASAGTELANAKLELAEGQIAILQAKDATQPASLVYQATCPYIYSAATVQGDYTTESAGSVSLLLSFDEGKSWQECWHNTGPSGKLDASLLNEVTGRYAYWLKVQLAAGSQAVVRGLTVRNTFVASPLALPGKLLCGENRITFVGGAPSAAITTTCRWTERHQSKLGVALNAISYYLNGDQAHRNLYVAAPGKDVTVEVTLLTRSQGEGATASSSGDITLAKLPKGWISQGKEIPSASGSANSATAALQLRPASVAEGDIYSFDVIVGDATPPRRVTAQVLVAAAALVREAEQADQTRGRVGAAVVGELSAARGVQFHGNGSLVFDLEPPAAGKYALWLRARWEPGSSTSMALAVDDRDPRQLRATAMIGFTDWTSPRQAHTKMFAHYGEQYGHWSWYRVPDVVLDTASRQLTLSAESGAWFDAVLLLPQNPTVDRAAMNLFQNWNYSPWHNPL